MGLMQEDLLNLSTQFMIYNICCVCCSDRQACTRLQLEEPDYDQRLQAHKQLTEARWASLLPAAACALLYRCLRDMRDATDLALRHAASQSLDRFVSTLSSAADTSEPTAEPAGSHPGDTVVSGVSDEPMTKQEMLKLVWRVMYPHVKSGLGAPNLAVRQVSHMYLGSVSWQPRLIAC